MAKQQAVSVNDADFWAKVKKFGSKVPFATDAVAMYYALLDPKTPTRHKAIVAGALIYWISPIDIVPDFIVGAGQLDDWMAIMRALAKVRKSVTDEHLRKARKALGLSNTEED